MNQSDYDFIPNQSEIIQPSIRSTLINYIQPFTDKKLLRILLMEYLGTIIFALGLQSAKTDFQIQIVIFFAMTFSFKHSGAHYHIAVTLILMFRPKYHIDRLRGFIQIITSILGFMTGTLLSYRLYGEATSPRLQSYDYEWVMADLFGEILATISFQFVNVLLFERNTAIFKVPIYNTILLTFAIYYSRKLSPHSGGCMNPSIAIGFNLAVAIQEQKYDLIFNDLWLFILGPMIGSFIVFIFYYRFIINNRWICSQFKSMGH